jgi:transposase
MIFSLDSLIEKDNPVRIINAFVTALDLGKMGFSKTKPALEGRPGYDPRDMTALYIYGNLHKVRSSRLLERECHVNIEMKWLMSELEPDFKTIADFRRDNPEALKNTFKEFNRMMRGSGSPEFYSIDGSKFRACNAKDRNFTLSKLDDRIDRMEIQIDEYMRQLDTSDSEEEIKGTFTADELQEKIDATFKRLETYRRYREYMQANGLSQLSLTDRDSALMKTKNTFEVAHNVQSVVESDTHMIADFVINGHPHDQGMLAPSMEGVTESNSDDRILECVADKGYNDRNDMADCLEKGVIPNVILPEGKDCYEVEFAFEEATITESDLADTCPETIKKCLRSGNIPDAYKDRLKDATIEEKVECIKEIEGSPLIKSEDEYKAMAANGYFVRDIEGNVVYCPAGKKLRQKSEQKDGSIRYSNKLACSRCLFRENCTKAKTKFKVVEFGVGSQISKCTLWQKQNENEGAVQEIKPVIHKTEINRTVVRYKLYPDREKMDQRKCLSEHPFGTVKRALNGGYFLTCGNRKVTGEIALSFLAYNIKRAISYYGFDEVLRKLMEARANISGIFICFLLKTSGKKINQINLHTQKDAA